MFVEQIKNLISNNPQIVMVTNRGLEDKDRNVIFIAKDLDSRYPELKSLFMTETAIEVTPGEIRIKRKKSKKK